MYFTRRHRRDGLELQLTAMIDIFTMIVIFLIKGTVMGASDMAVPKEMKLPKSYSKESVESAPQLVITDKEVRVSSLSKDTPAIDAVPLQAFKGAREAGNPAIEKLKTSLKAYVDKLPPQARAGGLLLNVITDQNTPYADLFDVVHVFREAGFESLLFIAQGEKMAGTQNSAAQAGEH